VLNVYMGLVESYKAAVNPLFLNTWKLSTLARSA